MPRNDAQHDAQDVRTRRFVQLFAKHERLVKRYILALLPHWTDADDVFAETSVRLWEQFDKYDPEKDFGSWACTIAHYQVLTLRNQRSRQFRLFSETFLEVVGDELRSQACDDSRLEMLRRCLAKLRGTHRKLVERVYADSTSLKEIAESLGETHTGLRKKLSRIRHKLHKCIRQGQIMEEQR